MIEKQPPITVVAKRLFPDKDINKLLCPFHDDHHPGSFKLFDKNNAYKCFSCGAFGHTVDLVKKVKHYSNREAYQYIKGKEFKKKKSKPIVSSHPVEEHHDIYLMFIQCFELNEEHKQYLNDRHITIRDDEYCSMPKREELSKFLTLVDKEELYKVPGFYRYKRSKEISMVETLGIGIAIKDAHNKIQGIQVRKDTVKRKESRYVWFSSSWIKDNPKAKQLLEGGGSCGCPIDVIQPVLTKKELLLTEGHFKASRFKEYFQCNAISIQGVGNYSDLVYCLHDLSITTIYIAYDSDIAYNEAVYLQLKKCVTYLLEHFEYQLYVLVFSIYDGKGIDDVLDQSKTNFYAIEPNLYFNFYKQYQLAIQKLKDSSIENKIEIYEYLANHILYKKEFLKQQWK